MAWAYDKLREGPKDHRALPPQGGAEPRVRGVCASFPHISTLDNPPLTVDEYVTVSLV